MSLKLYLYSNEPEDDRQAIAKKVSLFLVLSSLLLIIKGFIDGFSLIDFDPQLIVPMGIGLINILFVFFYHRTTSFIHLAILLGLSAIAIWMQYDSVYGFALWFAAFLLSRKYKIGINKPFITHFLFFLYIIIMVEVSLFRRDAAGVGFWYMSFLIVFVFLIYNLYKAEMNRVAYSEKAMQNSIHKLIEERTRLKEHIREKQKQLKELELQIETIKDEKEPFDLKNVGLTPAEMRIVEALVRSRGSNRDISLQLGIKENTVKQHLYKIFNKMGVDDRFQLIDLCKYNFE